MPCTRVIEMDMGKLVYSGFIFEMKTRELTDKVRCKRLRKEKSRMLHRFFWQLWKWWTFFEMESIGE